MNKVEIHSGYEFEAGMFSRMRSWVDVAPWIRLVRVLRILASPIYVGLVVLAWAVTQAAFSNWFDRSPQPFTPLSLESGVSSLLGSVLSAGVLRGVLFLWLTMLIWTPVLQLVCRAGAGLTAEQVLPSVRVTGRVIASRLWKSYLVPIVPLGCVLAFSVMVWLIRTPSLATDSRLIDLVTGWFIGMASIPIGILAFGALFSIPLGLVAMVCEPDPDPIDSTSRGYESLYRRPLSMIGYIALAWLLHYLVGLILGGVGWASSAAVTLIATAVSEDAVQREAAIGAIGTIVAGWRITFAFALLGGIYLLLRRDSCGQEVEELWSPPPTPTEPLPELPEEAYQS